MTTTESFVGEERARKEAQKVLTKEIGNLPHLGEAEYEEPHFIFPLNMRSPRVIFDKEGEEPRDVRFMSNIDLGEIKVHEETGEVVHKPSIGNINRKIKSQKKQIRESVSKALVSSAAERFSRLPFSEARFTPIKDIIARVVMNGEMYVEEIEDMREDDRAKYEEYLEHLLEINLLRREGNRVEAEDPLIEIEDRFDQRTEMVNAAMAYFFKNGESYMDDIKEILGPYLVLTSFYYLRALEIGELPAIREDEFRVELKKSYSPSDREVKDLKLANYLIQLEKIGMFQTSSNQEWEGSEEVYENLLTDEALDPVSELIA
jgi:hypothetical protein